MKSILIISEFIHASENSTGYFWEKIITHVRAEGHTLETVSLKHKSNSTERYLAARVIAKGALTFRLLMKTILKVKNFDFVLSGTNPEFLFLALAVVRKIVKFRWLVVVHDIFPENLIPARIARKNSILFRFLKRIFQWAYNKPDRLLVIGRDMKDIIKAKRVPEDRIKYVPLWVNVSEIELRSKRESRIIRELGWEDRTVFLFFGNIGRVQGLKTLLEAIRLVTSEKAAFLFIGGGSESGTLIEFIESSNLKNVRYYGKLPQMDKSEGLNSCDVAIVSLAPGMRGLGVPSKAYFSLAADKPLLAIVDSDSEIDKLIEENNVGWACSPNNVRKIAKTIDLICEQDLSELKGRPRRVAEECYSENLILRKLANEFTL